MVGDIDTQRRQGNLSSAIRLFVLDNMRSRTPEFAHKRDGADMTLASLQSHG